MGNSEAATSRHVRLFFLLCVFNRSPVHDVLNGVTVLLIANSIDETVYQQQLNLSVNSFSISVYFLPATFFFSLSFPSNRTKISSREFQKL